MMYYRAIKIDLAHTSRASRQGKTIKLADVINNSESILEHDPQFARVYLSEKKKLLEVLVQGDAALYARAKSILFTFSG